MSSIDCINMNTFAIEKILKKIAVDYKKKYKKKLFHLVCACDLLPKEVPINQDVIIVVNIDESNKQGSHWQSIFITRNNRKCYFFDSYGYAPTNPYIKRFIINNSNTITWNKRQLQSYYSYSCGEFCCMFAYSMAKNKAFTCFFNQFNKKLNLNDEKIRALFDCIFKKRSCTQQSKKYIKCVSGR